MKSHTSQKYKTEREWISRHSRGYLLLYVQVNICAYARGTCSDESNLKALGFTGHVTPMCAGAVTHNIWLMSAAVAFKLSPSYCATRARQALLKKVKGNTTGKTPTIASHPLYPVSLVHIVHIYCLSMFEIYSIISITLLGYMYRGQGVASSGSDCQLSASIMG